MQRRQFLAAASASACLLSWSGAATAQWNPDRPLNIIVPYAAGGGVDAYARAIAAAAVDRFPVPVVIVNRPGAGGITGAIEASRARPDGNTILLHSSGSFLLGQMFNDVAVGPFDSFQTIAQIGNLNSALVVPVGSPFKTMQDLIDAARANSGSLRWAHNGRGGVFHVAGQIFLDSQGLEAVDIPFQGGANSRVALISEEVDFAVLGIQQLLGFESQLRPLAVSDTERDAVQPDVPTFNELGYDVPVINSPIILFAPLNVDENIVSGLESAMREIVEAPEFVNMVREQGTLPLYRTGEQATSALRDIERAAQPVINALRAS